MDIRVDVASSNEDLAETSCEGIVMDQLLVEDFRVSLYIHRGYQEGERTFGGQTVLDALKLELEHLAHCQELSHLIGNDGLSESILALIVDQAKHAVLKIRVDH